MQAITAKGTSGFFGRFPKNKAHRGLRCGLLCCTLKCAQSISGFSFSPLTIS